MDAPRQAGSIASRALVFGATIAIGLAGSIAMLGERGAFAPTGPGRPIAPIDGMTVVDDADDASFPVVTSLRSDGEAERRGIRVGDRIAAIDGHPVRDVEGLVRAIRTRATPGPVSLHIRRGDAIWTVAIDRVEPESRGTEPHDPQDPAG